MQSLTQYSGSVLIYGLVAYLLLTGRQRPAESELGAFISKHVSLSMMFLYKLEMLNGICSDFGQWLALSRRLAPLLCPAHADPASSLTKIEKTAQDQVVLTADYYTLRLASGQVLVHPFSLSLVQGQSLIVLGASGVGKTTFLRALVRPDPALYFKYRATPLDYMFVSNDVSFLPLSHRLIDQILHPRRLEDYRAIFSKNAPTLDTVRLCFDLAGLSFDRLTQLNPKNNMNPALDDYTFLLDILSRGERQRFSLVRLLFWRPKLVLLDEAFSSLEPEAQRFCYVRLAEHHIDFIATAHADAQWQRPPIDNLCLLHFRASRALFSCP